MQLQKSFCFSSSRYNITFDKIPEDEEELKRILIRELNKTGCGNSWNFSSYSLVMDRKFLGYYKDRFETCKSIDYIGNGCQSQRYYTYVGNGINKQIQYCYTTGEFCLGCYNNVDKGMLESEYYRCTSIYITPNVIKHDPSLIKKVCSDHYRFLELCRLAISEDPSTIRYIKDQTLKLCMLAISEDPSTIRYIKDQTLEICMLAISEDPSTIRYIKTRGQKSKCSLDNYKEICQFALQQDPWTLRLIDHRSLGERAYLELCQFAVQAEPFVLRYTQKQSPQMVFEAVMKYPHLIRHVKDLNVQLCWQVLEEDPKTILSIRADNNYPNADMVLSAIKRDRIIFKTICPDKGQPHEIFYNLIDKVYDNELCLDLIKDDYTRIHSLLSRLSCPEVVVDQYLKQDPSLIQYCQSQEMCLKAVEIDPHSIQYMDKFVMKQKGADPYIVCEKALSKDKSVLKYFSRVLD